MGLMRIASISEELGYECKIVDENNTNTEPLSFNEDFDLIALSALMPLAPRAYEISDQFRKRGKKTVIGGIHVTFMPEEATEHADVVVRGEADKLWEEVLQDFENNNLKKIYGPVLPVDLDSCKGKFLFPVSYHIPGFHVAIIQTSRGCPMGCDFCSVSDMNGRKLRHRSVSKVVDEIRKYFSSYSSSSHKFLIFIDDNLIGDRQYAFELFQALEPLHINFLCLVDIRIGTDSELLAAAVKSGLTAVFVGFESIDKNVLSSGISRPKASWHENYETAIYNLHGVGVMVHGSFIFGFDTHTPDVFKRTIDWAIDNAVDCAQFTIMTPFPGTNLFQRLADEHRIIAYDNNRILWKNFTGMNVVFKPIGIFSEKLQEGFNFAYKSFYSYKSIFSRFLRWKSTHRSFLKNILAILSNIDFRRMEL